MPNESDRRLVEGWDGRYFEDFEEAHVYNHPFGRTVTETDDVWITNVTKNPTPVHFNEEYASRTAFAERLVKGPTSSRWP